MKLFKGINDGNMSIELEMVQPTNAVHTNNNNNNNNNHDNNNINHIKQKHMQSNSSFGSMDFVGSNGSGSSSSSSRFSSLQEESLRSAILDSFRGHWQQAWATMNDTAAQRLLATPSKTGGGGGGGDDFCRDNVSTIINHLEQMISLLGEESATISTHSGGGNNNNNNNNLSSLKTSLDPMGSMEDPLSALSSGGFHQAAPTLGSSLLDYMLKDCLLDKVYHWSETAAGEWKAAMYLEQLKFFDLLINSQLCSAVTLFQQAAFLRPLLQLLLTLASPEAEEQFWAQASGLLEVEKRLVLLLSTLCAVLNQHPQLLELFLVATSKSSSSPSTVTSETLLGKLDATSTSSSCRGSFTSQGSPSNGNNNNNNDNNNEDSLLTGCDTEGTSFVSSPQSTYVTPSHSSDPNQFTFPVLLLLIKFVHSDGAVGQQSRDALLLLLRQTRSEDRLAYYLVTRTIFCPVLAEGLSGRFSALPRIVVGRSMTAEQFQLKDELLRNSVEIEAFLRLLEFTNAVVEISHSVVQRYLLNLIHNGFLVSVIGPALHQDVTHVSIEDLETLSTHSNTLDEIITKTAYLDLFIRSISEKNLIRTFLEFLCFGTYENKNVLDTLISRIAAKSKLSLITLILFRTLLDLNCEDLHFELIHKYLMRGQHLALSQSDSNSDKTSTSTLAVEYQQNWLSASGQKLFNSSVSQYLCHSGEEQDDDGGEDGEEESSTIYHPLASASAAAARGHGGGHQLRHLHTFFEYLLDAQQSIEQCQRSMRNWKNRFDDYCLQLNHIDDENIVFCGRETNDCEQPEEKLVDCEDEESLRQPQSMITEDTIDLTSLTPESMGSFSHSLVFAAKLPHHHHQRKIKSNLSLLNLQNIQFDEQTNRIYYGPQQNANWAQSNGRLGLYYPENSPEYLTATHIGLFLTTLFERLENFFDNDILTNLHLTGLLTRLCHFPHRLLLQLFFDETLSRDRDVPCLLHLLQKISLAAQGYCDRIYDFENLFRAARSSLQSMPIGEMNCKLLTGDYHQQPTLGTSMVATVGQPESPSSNKRGLKSLKNFFFGGTSKANNNNNNKTSSSVVTLQRQPSNSSIVSSASQMLEILPGGARFLNQLKQKAEHMTPTTGATNRALDKQSELIYNLIIFDEFLLELSATLVEQELHQIQLFD